MPLSLLCMTFLSKQGASEDSSRLLSEERLGSQGPSSKEAVMFYTQPDIPILHTPLTRASHFYFQISHV